MIKANEQKQQSSVEENKPDELKKNEQDVKNVEDSPVDNENNYSYSLPDSSLNIKLQTPIIPKLYSNADDSAKTKELTEEIADDMVHVMERLNTIEANQERLTKQIDLLIQSITENRKQFTIELDKFRQEVLGERKSLAARSTFNAIVPTVDSLRMMKKGIPYSEENAQVNAQLYAVVSSLNNIIQSLDFNEFDVEIGSAFDSERMECLDYAKEGELNTVVAVVRPGYKAGNTIIRPCGVIIAKPSHDKIQGKGGESNE